MKLRSHHSACTHQISASDMSHKVLLTTRLSPITIICLVFLIYTPYCHGLQNGDYSNSPENSKHRSLIKDYEMRHKRFNLVPMNWKEFYTLYLKPHQPTFSTDGKLTGFNSFPVTLEQKKESKPAREHWKVADQDVPPPQMSPTVRLLLNPSSINRFKSSSTSGNSGPGKHVQRYTSADIPMLVLPAQSETTSIRGLSEEEEEHEMSDDEDMMREVEDEIRDDEDEMREAEDDKEEKLKMLRQALFSILGRPLHHREIKTTMSPQPYSNTGQGREARRKLVDKWNLLVHSLNSR